MTRRARHEQGDTDHRLRRPNFASPQDREEYLARGTPFPPPEEVAIDDLTDEEADAFWMAITDDDIQSTPPYRRSDMTAQDPQHPRRERPRPMTREEHLACGRPIRPLEEMAIEDPTDEEWDAFWSAINEA